MSDINRDLLLIILEFKLKSETLDIKDDPDMVKLIYREIDNLLNKGIISDQVAQELKSLPVNKLMLTYDEVQKKLAEFLKKK